jgi:predicted HAD superfamily Cof-like phosphohydrolase
MNEFLEKVKCFHDTFNAPVLDTPQMPSEDRCELRVELLQEELNELKLAIENDDLVEILDAFVIYHMSYMVQF